MLRKYLIISLRLLWRQKLYSVLNILGLAVALAVSLIMFNHVKVELSYDKHFPESERIYRVINKTVGERGEWDWATTAPLLAEDLNKSIPELEGTFRFRVQRGVYIEERSDTNDIKGFPGNDGFYTDSSVFDILDIPFLYGDKTSALSDPKSVVLTASLSRKIYGQEDPVGRTLYIFGGNPCTVTGVIADFPGETHFKCDFLLDWQLFVTLMKSVNLEDLYYNRGWAGVYTYAMLKDGIDIESLTDKLFKFRKGYYSADLDTADIGGSFALQPITHIHLRSNLEEEIEANGNIKYIIVFAMGALFILIIAGVNYINIATARAFKRMKEVGIRKVTGARRIQLVNQFQAESLFTVLIAALLSILFIDLIIPFYNDFTGKLITSGDIFTMQNIILFILIILLLGSLSGLYPSLFASGFRAVDAIHELHDPSSRTNFIRRILVVLQFAVSIFMIFTTIVIYRQMNYFSTKNLGFDRSQVINMRLNGELWEWAVYNPQKLKDEMSRIPVIMESSVTSHIIGDRFSVEGIDPEGFPEDAEKPSLRFLRVDEDFIDLLKIELIEGQNFDLPPEGESQFMLNKKAVEVLGLEYPVGTRGTSFFGQYGEITGVVDDFHFASLHHPIEPLVLEYNLGQEFRQLWVGNMLVRLIPGDSRDLIPELKKHIEKIAPDNGFNYEFIDDKFDRLYQSEANLRDIFRAFALFTIFITCLGLFGLSAFTAELRTKEIGIRKSQGARLGGIVVLLSRQFMAYVLLSLVIALPAGYFYCRDWLQNYAYKISLRPWEFILAGMIALVIAFISVSYQAVRAGRMNPVKALRYE
jgi:putative ABC transport system permease protein